MTKKEDPDNGFNKATRRQFLGSALALGAAGTLGGLNTACSSLNMEGLTPRRRPNLVYVFSDQQSHDMLGCYGNEQIITPNIDRFATQSVRFNHCVSNSPVCTPYRAMLMSGQHCLNCGAFANDIQLLAGGGNYFGEVMRDAGYRMGYVGKWHLYGGDRDRPIPAGPYRYGFDDYFLSNNCTLRFGPGEAWYWDEQGRKVIYDEWEPYGQTRQALDFLDDCAQNPDDPFALFVSYHPPHDEGIQEGRFCYDTIPELMDKYDRNKIKLRPNVEDSPGVRRDYHGHMAMCTGIDEVFGQIVDKLKEKGLEEDTIVIFTSDHGDLLSSCGKPWAKAFAEDGSCRVPMLMRYPERLPAGTTSDLLFGSMDIMPTMLSLMGLTPPATCQGLDLSQAILNQRDDAVAALPLYMIAVGNGWRGIYTREHTYAYDKEVQQKISFDCLYDKKKDPWQCNNLFDESSSKALQEEMHRQTHQLMEKYDDTFVPGHQLMKECFGDLKKLTGPGQTVVLPGRPIDIIKGMQVS